MANVIIVIYLLVVLALIAVILLQRSEGGGLGLGGGGNSGGGLISARGSANLLTRATAILAGLFMLLAISLTVINDIDSPNIGALDAASLPENENTTVFDALGEQQGDSDLALPGLSDDVAAPVEDAGTSTTDANSDLALPTSNENQNTSN